MWSTREKKQPILERERECFRREIKPRVGEHFLERERKRFRRVKTIVEYFRKRK